MPGIRNNASWLALVTLAAVVAAGWAATGAGSAWAQTASATQKQDDDRSLALLVERLSGRIGVIGRRLRLTRRALRKSQTRIERLEEESGSPANARRLVSPDRRFSILASNHGVRLLGPDAFVGLGANTITLDSGSSDTQLKLTPVSAGLRAATGVFDFAATGSLRRRWCHWAGAPAAGRLHGSTTRCERAARAGWGRSPPGASACSLVEARFAPPSRAWRSCVGCRSAAARSCASRARRP